jgi:hypothetical protein
LKEQSKISYLLFFLLLSVNAFSQNISKVGTTDSTNHVYSYGIQYYLVDGIFIAFKFNNHFPNIWRIKCDFSGSIADNSSYYKNYNSADELTGKREYDSYNSTFNFGISIEYNYFFLVHKRFQPYIGIGPVWSYSYNTDQYSQKSELPPNFSSSMESSTRNYGIGLIAVGGIESELINYVSLFAEYNLTYTYNLQRSEHKEYSPINELQSRTKTTGHNYVFKQSAAKIGIIIFF